jgi:hypothetical protein
VRAESPAPGELSRIHAVRQATQTRFDNGARIDAPDVLHASADIAANRRERLDGAENAGANARAKADSYRATKEFLKRALAR